MTNTELIELLDGLRNNGDDCECGAHGFCECGCGANWSEHHAEKAADTIEAQAKQIAELQADAEYGRIAFRFVDRAGDVADCDPAERICAEFYKAMCDALEINLAAARKRTV